MNRRRFLKAALGAAAALVIPISAPTPRPLTFEMVCEAARRASERGGALEAFDGPPRAYELGEHGDHRFFGISKEAYRMWKT